MPDTKRPASEVHHTGPLWELTALGQGTARTVKVLRTVTEKWC